MHQYFQKIKNVKLVLMKNIINEIFENGAFSVLMMGSTVSARCRHLIILIHIHITFIKKQKKTYNTLKVWAWNLLVLVTNNIKTCFLPKNIYIFYKNGYYFVPAVFIIINTNYCSSTIFSWHT